MWGCLMAPPSLWLTAWVNIANLIGSLPQMLMILINTCIDHELSCFVYRINSILRAIFNDKDQSRMLYAWPRNISQLCPNVELDLPWTLKASMDIQSHFWKFYLCWFIYLISKRCPNKSICLFGVIQYWRQLSHFALVFKISMGQLKLKLGGPTGHLQKVKDKGKCQRCPIYT